MLRVKTVLAVALCLGIGPVAWAQVFCARDLVARDQWSHELKTAYATPIPLFSMPDGLAVRASRVNKARVLDKSFGPWRILDLFLRGKVTAQAMDLVLNHPGDLPYALNVVVRSDDLTENRPPDLAEFLAAHADPLSSQFSYLIHNEDDLHRLADAAQMGGLFISEDLIEDIDATPLPILAGHAAKEFTGHSWPGWAESLRKGRISLKAARSIDIWRESEPLTLTMLIFKSKAAYVPGADAIVIDHWTKQDIESSLKALSVHDLKLTGEKRNHYAFEVQIKTSEELEGLRKFVLNHGSSPILILN